MKTKTPVSSKKQTITVRDLTTRKNPKGGGDLIPGVSTEIGPKKGTRH